MQHKVFRTPGQCSPLAYPGGKSKRTLRLLRLVDKSKNRYVEIFSGGLGMLFRARRERLFRTYSANDLNENLINFYTILRDYPDEMLKDLWKCYNKHGPGDEDLFQRCVEDLTSSNAIRRAVAYFIRNKWSRNGFYTPNLPRTGAHGKGITPIMLDRLSVFSELLNGVKLTCVDYRHVEIPKSAFVFADPPYERVGSICYEHKVDLCEFSEWAKHLQCSWLISLNNSDFTNSLFSEYDRIEEPVNYAPMANSKTDSDKVRDATEIIITNYQRRSRDAFLRSFQWELRKAQPSSKAC